MMCMDVKSCNWLRSGVSVKCLSSWSDSQHYWALSPQNTASRERAFWTLSLNFLFKIFNFKLVFFSLNHVLVTVVRNHSICFCAGRCANVQPVCYRMSCTVWQIDVSPATSGLPGGTSPRCLPLLPGVRVRRGRILWRQREARGPRVRWGAGVLGLRRGGIYSHGEEEKQIWDLRVQSHRAGLWKRWGILPEYLRAKENQPPGAEAAAATCSFHSAGSLRER